MAAGQRREIEVKFTFLSPVERWGKSPDPSDQAVWLNLLPWLSGNMENRWTDRHLCLGRARRRASHWVG